MRVLLMGPPGAGKGTQAKRLSVRFDMAHLSSGDILRAERASGSDLGNRVKAYMDAGDLVPDPIIVEVMAKAIAEIPVDKGLLLDGFPRTVAQAETLDAQLGELSCPLQAVLVIDTPDELLVERITGRRSCPQCGAVYHVKYMPPANDNVCDKDGAELVQRTDDTESVVRERLAAYRRQTAPVIDYYKAADRQEVVYIDGSGSPDEVTALAVAALEAAAG
jgi:adenylate kinase